MSPPSRAIQRNLRRGELFRAVRRDDLAQVQALLKEGFTLHEFEGGTSVSLLHAACGSGSVEVLTYAIANGVDVDEPAFGSGATPLMTAIENNRYPCVKILIDAGANPHRPDYQKLSILHYAVSGSLFAEEQDIAALQKRLLGCGLDFNAQDVDGRTPLHFAKFYQAEAWIDFLIQQGADPGIEDRQGVAAR